MLEELELAHVYIARLHQRLADSEARSRSLESRLKRLTEAVTRLETIADQVQLPAAEQTFKRPSVDGRL